VVREISATRVMVRTFSYVNLCVCIYISFPKRRCGGARTHKVNLSERYEMMMYSTSSLARGTSR
jgi:hypothetical protein